MNSFLPANYDMINQYCGEINPSTVHTQNNQLFYYFRRYLIQKAMSVYKWTIPENWNLDYFLYTLYCVGYLAVLETADYGVVPQYCTLTGYDIFYRPVSVTVTPPGTAKTYTREIGKDCVLFKLTTDFFGIGDMINQYAERLALCAQSLSVNLVNSHLSYVIFADNKSQAEAFKKMTDKIISGEPCVVTGVPSKTADGNSKKWETFSQNLKQNYLVSDLLVDMRKIEDMFCTEIGLPNANTSKRERLLVDEVNANNVETESRPQMWLDNLKKSCEDVKKMFNIDISVDWRNKGGEKNEIVNSGDLSL